MANTLEITQAASSIMSVLSGPNAPRALLVSINRTGLLELVPLNQGQSVINIETELHDHLSAAPRSDAFLIELRDYCDCRLAARAEAKATGGFCIPKKGGGWTITHAPAFYPIPAEAAQSVH